MTVIRTTKDPATLTLTVVADFDASPDRVWEVWEDPRKLERWWGPPTYPSTFTRHDFVLGGESRYFMTGQAELGMALILITHDLGVVAEVADRIAVVYAGQTVEQAAARDLFEAPGHPYTQGLLASIPQLGKRNRRLQALPCSPPILTAPPVGCPFRPRCRFAQAICAESVPSLRTVGPAHESACHFAEEVLAHV